VRRLLVCLVSLVAVLSTSACATVAAGNAARPARATPPKATGGACDTPDCDPITPTYNKIFTVGDARGKYWVEMGDRKQHVKPYALLVWMHGCTGHSPYELPMIHDQSASAHYIAIAPSGAEGGCWLNPQDPKHTGPGRVLVAMRSAISHFNIDPNRVFIGGNSSGGNLAYLTAFHHSRLFAGVLAVNTAPFYGTGSSEAQSLAAAHHTFHVAHLAHKHDEAYAYPMVVRQLDALRRVGFPVALRHRPGAHWVYPTSGNPDSGTAYDVTTVLMPFMSRGWHTSGN
jgi:poly(3-hydroxybutyrate) depolymerase